MSSTRTGAKVQLAHEVAEPEIWILSVAVIHASRTEPDGPARPNVAKTASTPCDVTTIRADKPPGLAQASQGVTIGTLIRKVASPAILRPLDKVIAVGILLTTKTTRHDATARPKRARAATLLVMARAIGLAFLGYEPLAKLVAVFLSPMDAVFALGPLRLIDEPDAPA